MKHRSLLRVVVVAAAAVAAPCAAVRADFEALADQPYREFFNPANPVKGEALLGLSVVPQSADVQLTDQISVWFGEHYEGPVTVETLAADGAFRGVGSFDGATDRVGWNSITIAGGAGRARPTSPEGLAIAVRGKEPNEFRIAHWGEPPASDEGLVLRLYVNSRRGDMSVRAGSVVVPCKRVELARPLRFDVYCDLAMKDLPASNAIDLIRRDGFHIEAQPIVILH
jgi:hypothetical protein